MNKINLEMPGWINQESSNVLVDAQDPEKGIHFSALAESGQVLSFEKTGLQRGFIVYEDMKTYAEFLMEQPWMVREIVNSQLLSEIANAIKNEDLEDESVKEIAELIEVL
ncbi:MAG: hypothetical protein ACOCQR_03130 [bacterium]